MSVATVRKMYRYTAPQERRVYRKGIHLRITALVEPRNYD
jgi:hypothetical protein